MVSNNVKVVEKPTMHKSLRFIIVIAQIFGFFPVQGVFGKDERALHFSCFSIAVIIVIPTWLGGWFCASFHIKELLLNKYNPYDMNGFIFNFNNGTYCLLFIFLARDWPSLMREWRIVDKNLEKYGWPESLNSRLKLTATIFLSLEACEHFTVQINKALVAYQCKSSLQKSMDHFLVNMTFSHIFSIVEYSAWKGIFLQIINTRLAFCWTYCDLLIILICCCLATRFRQITKRIKKMSKEETVDTKEWEIIREDYTKLCKLSSLVDGKFANLIIWSFVTNVYFVIFHLFRSLNVKESPLETVYFVISFALLILRIFCVCWYGGWVYEEAKAPMTYLISYNDYNIEIERFIDKIRFEGAFITGKNFFSVTKNLILHIANAIVTYELVVIQFNGGSVKKKVSKWSMCGDDD